MERRQELDLVGEQTGTHTLGDTGTGGWWRRSGKLGLRAGGRLDCLGNQTGQGQRRLRLGAKEGNEEKGTGRQWVWGRWRFDEEPRGNTGTGWVRRVGLGTSGMERRREGQEGRQFW